MWQSVLFCVVTGFIASDLAGLSMVLAGKAKPTTNFFTFFAVEVGVFTTLLLRMIGKLPIM